MNDQNDDRGRFLGWFNQDQHRTVGSRAWCACNSWCYPESPCYCCGEPLYELEIDRLRRALGEDEDP